MDTVLHIQGDPDSHLTPLILVHAISGLALPYLSLGSLSNDANDGKSRPVYGISSPIYESMPYRPANSLTQVASQYVDVVRAQIRSKGPYLLGGWSMGGMIAVEMASIFRSQGDEVRHILLVDSLNPDFYPDFEDSHEHHRMASITYNNVARSMGAPEMVIGAEDDSASSGEESQGEESGSEAWSSDSEDDEDFLLGPRVLSTMQKHISQGLRLLGNKKQHTPHRFDLGRTDVTLIKCNSLSQFSPHMSENRKTFARKISQNPTLGWNTNKFRSFRTLKFSAQHDTCFDRLHVEELTRLMKGVLTGVRI